MTRESKNKKVRENTINTVGLQCTMSDSVLLGQTCFYNVRSQQLEVNHIGSRSYDQSKGHLKLANKYYTTKLGGISSIIFGPIKFKYLASREHSCV